MPLGEVIEKFLAAKARLVFALVFTAHCIGRHCSIPHRFRGSS